MLMMVGVSLQTHFGEYLAHLGYGVDDLGWAVGVGVVGSLLLRPVTGMWIDRAGCRSAFLASSIVASLATLAFSAVRSFPLLCCVRVFWSASTATFLATVAVFAARMAPPHRRAESLGTIGIGGFIGMMIGPALGDFIFAGGLGIDSRFTWFFGAGAGLSLAAGCVVSLRAAPNLPAATLATSTMTLWRRHWPGRMLLIPVVFAAALTIQMSFLERFADARHFATIRWFFLAYAPTAIVVRLAFRHGPERLGRRRVCAVGLCLVGLGLLLLIPVRSDWHLLFSGLAWGAGHSLTYPSMVDLVAGSMPPQWRGVGTTLALGAMDLGFMTAGITWGHTIDRYGYSATFLAAALLSGLAGALMALGWAGGAGPRSASLAGVEWSQPSVPARE